MKFNITQIRPKGFPHTSAFTEVIDSLAWSLASLGHEPNVSHNWISKEQTNIIFGGELLAPNQPEAIPAGSIIYNLEQPSHPCMDKVRAVAIGSKAIVWDYSLTNVKMWAEHGVAAKHVPIGYTPNLTRIPKAAVQDIDVSMFACMTPRRNEIIRKLIDAGLKVYISDNCYGGGRDNIISRSKICLNVHHDGRNLFEAVRVSYLLANGKRVVSETSEDDSEYADLGPTALLLRPYDEIVRTVIDVLEAPESFNSFAIEAIRKRDFTSTVSRALTEPSPSQKVAARFEAAKQHGDMKDFVQFIKDNAKGTCMEIGVRDGASTAAFLGGVERNGGVTLSLDVEDCSGLFAGHPQWKFIRSRSDNPKLRIPALDVLLIDGDHTREGYLKDLEKYFPLVNPGGLILSHDISPESGETLEDLPGSDRPSIAIREEYFKFCREHGLEHEELPGKYGMGVMRTPTYQNFRATSPLECKHCGQRLDMDPMHECRVDSDESWQASEALLK